MRKLAPYIVFIVPAQVFTFSVQAASMLQPFYIEQAQILRQIQYNNLLKIIKNNLFKSK